MQFHVAFLLLSLTRRSFARAREIPPLRSCLLFRPFFRPCRSEYPRPRSCTRKGVSFGVRVLAQRPAEERGLGSQRPERHARALVLASSAAMFVPPPAALTERQQQQSRGYVLGLILLILFLSSQDFSPPSRRRVEAAQGAREGLVRHREDVKDRLIVDLSASNERLELENRRLKVAAIGLAGELRRLGKNEQAEAYNLTSVGVFSGDDARDSSSEPQTDAGASSDGRDAVHVDEGMRLREAMREKTKTKRGDGDGDGDETKVYGDEKGKDATATVRRALKGSRRRAMFS